MKKNYRVFAAVVAAAAMISACGTDAATTDSTAESSATEASGTEASATDSSASDAAATETSSIDISGLKTTTLMDVDIDSLVTLGEYKGITIEATKTEVTDEDVEAEVSSAISTTPLMKQVTDRAVQNGDTVNIDYEGKYADTKEAFDGGTAQGYDLVIGSGSFIDGFEDGLVGAEIGQTLDLNLTFPEDYGATDLAGKEVIFTVTVNSISVADTEVTDEWVKSLGIDGVSTVDEFKANIRTQLEEENQSAYDENIRNTAVEMVTDASTVSDIPEELYNRYFVMIYKSLESYTQQVYYMYGVTVSPEEYVQTVMQNNGLTGTVDDYLSDVANQQTTRCMVLQAIANKEGIEISEETVDKYIQEDYDTYFKQQYDSIDAYKATLDTEDYREQIMAEQVADFLVENATVKEAQ